MMHGLFIIMGGDHLFECISKKTGSSNGRILQEDDKPLHLLQKSKLQSSDEYKSFVMPTEVEIKDREKSDWLTNSLVLLQTLWFVIEITRGQASEI